MTLPLNIAQERELYRLLEYERKNCSANNELMYHCAFPLRPDDDLQQELIDHRMLAKKEDVNHGTVVVITSDGYSYFPERSHEQKEEAARRKRDARLIALTAIFCCICMVVGFLCGFLAR